MKKNLVMSLLVVAVSLGIQACDKGGDSMQPAAMAATTTAMAPSAPPMAPGADKMAPAPMAAASNGMTMDHGGPMGNGAMDHGPMGAGSAPAPGNSMGHGAMAAPSSSMGMAH